jgi:hypothetical protein
MVYIYIPNSTTYDIASLLRAQLDAMRAEGVQTSSADLDIAMKGEFITAPHSYTNVDDEPVPSIPDIS